MEITSVQVRVNGRLSPGDPVKVTISGPSLPEVFEVEGWVRDSHFEIQWPEGHQYNSTIQWFVPRDPKTTGEILDDF